MMIDRINSIDPIQGGKKTSRSESIHSTGPVDSVALSSEAIEKADLYHAVELVSASSDVRADRVAELKAKINDPAYINEVVLKGTVDRIMDAFGL